MIAYSFSGASSSIAALAWHISEKLIVVFNTGAVWLYLDVPHNDACAIMVKADCDSKGRPSHGATFIGRVKNKRYANTKLGDFSIDDNTISEAISDTNIAHETVTVLGIRDYLTRGWDDATSKMPEYMPPSLKLRAALVAFQGVA